MTPPAIRMNTREDLVRELTTLGFRTVEEEHSGRTVLWMGGLRRGYIPARLPRAADAVRLYVESVRWMRTNGFPLPRPYVPEPEEVAALVPSVPVSLDTGQDITELRRLATVEAVGASRADRVTRWGFYCDVFFERFGVYPRQPGLGAGYRPIRGRCPHCDQPEELSCVEGCLLTDRLETIWPTTRPRGPRPWSRPTHR